MLRVSRSYRRPIENLCARIGVAIGAWPDLCNVEHYSRLEALLDEALTEVKLQFRAQQGLLYESLQIADRSDALVTSQTRRIQALSDELEAQRYLCFELEQSLAAFMEIGQ